MTIVYPSALPAGTEYWKYGPTPAQPSPHWYVLPSTLAGSTLAFSITDGALGDDDLAANGAIVDQGGPGVPGVPGLGPIVQVPTLSEWALLLLTAMMAWMGFAAIRRRAG
jgi:hypothetical protein